MYFSSRYSLVASITKHDIAGIVLAVVAVALIVAGGAKLATKAVKGVLALLVLGVLAAVVAVLLFTAPSDTQPFRRGRLRREGSAGRSVVPGL